MVEKKLQEAKVLIEARKYSEARLLLKTMGDHPTAKRWLAKLDELSPPSSPAATTNANESVLQQAKRLLDEKRYDEARALLTPIRQDKTAARWLAKLDQMSAPTKASPPSPPSPTQVQDSVPIPSETLKESGQTNPSRRPAMIGLAVAAIVVVIGLVLALSGAFNTGGRFNRATPEGTMGAYVDALLVQRDVETVLELVCPEERGSYSLGAAFIIGGVTDSGVSEIDLSGLTYTPREQTTDSAAIQAGGQMAYTRQGQRIQSTLDDFVGTDTTTWFIRQNGQWVVCSEDQAEAIAQSSGQSVQQSGDDAEADTSDQNISSEVQTQPTNASDEGVPVGESTTVARNPITDTSPSTTDAIETVRRYVHAYFVDQNPDAVAATQCPQDRERMLDEATDYLNTLNANGITDLNVDDVVYEITYENGYGGVTVTISGTYTATVNGERRTDSVNGLFGGAAYRNVYQMDGVWLICYDDPLR